MPVTRIGPKSGKDPVEAVVGGLGYRLNWGGNFGPFDQGDFATKDDNGEALPEASTGPKTEHIVTEPGTISIFTWGLTLTGGSTMKIHLNDVVVETIVTSGATGSDSSLSTDVVAGDRVSIENDAGGGTGIASFALQIA